MSEAHAPARRHAREAGVAATEYVGLLLVVSVIVSSLVVVPAFGAENFTYQVCRLVSAALQLDGGCTPPPPPKDRAVPLGVACVTNRTDNKVGYNLLVEGVRGDRADGDTVTHDGTGKSSVKINQGGGIGVEAATNGSGKASAKARASILGDVAYEYVFTPDMGGADAANKFREDQRGGWGDWRSIAQTAMPPGTSTIYEGATRAKNGIVDGWNWARKKVGMGPSQAEIDAHNRQRRAGEADSMIVSLTTIGEASASLAAGVVKGGAGAKITTTGSSKVTLSGDGSSTFKGLIQLDANAQATFGVSGVRKGKKGPDGKTTGTDIPPFLNARADGMGSGAYEVKFDKDGNPETLTFTTEYSGTVSGGLKPTAKGGGGKVTPNIAGKDGQLHQEVRVLDLKDPTNRALFDKTFVTVGETVNGSSIKVVAPRIGLTPQENMAFGANAAALWDRTNKDAYVANFTYDVEGDEYSGEGGNTANKEKGIKAGVYGGGVTKTKTTLKLVQATAHDNRTGEAPHTLATCSPG